jgi:hypothetical protein
MNFEYYTSFGKFFGLEFWNSGEEFWCGTVNGDAKFVFLFAVMLLQSFLLYSVYHNLLIDWISLRGPFCRYFISLNISLARIITIFSRLSIYLEGGQRTVSLVCIVCCWYQSRSHCNTNQLRISVVGYISKYLNDSRFVIFDIYIYIGVCVCVCVCVCDTRWRSWLRHCATSRKITGFVLQSCHWNFSLT